MEKTSGPWKKVGVSLLLIAVMFVLGGVSELVKVSAVEVPTGEGSSLKLPTVNTIENLKKLLEQCRGAGRNDLLYMDSAKGVGRIALETEKNEAAVPQDTAVDFSQTNRQVAGVDEADIVKNDGKYIYHLQESGVNIITAVPADNMQVVSHIDVASNFMPQEMFVDSNHLVLIGSRYFYEHNRDEQKFNQKGPCTQIVVYNIALRNKPIKVRQVEVEGNYISARKINNSLYVVADRYINYWDEAEKFIPVYYDSSLGDSCQEIALDKVRYFPGCVTPDYLTIAGIDLNRESEPAQIDCFLGGGDTVYASAEALFIALEHYKFYPIPFVDMGIMPASAPEQRTKIFAFKLKANGKFELTAEGEVPGSIINQFSMDQHNGYFRIATTVGNTWGTGADISKNNVYVLDGQLQLKGKIEGIAPGEKIYSVRFMGDRAYMVTFRNTDPFFVLDFKNPAEPKILGKLKLPGYSDYLHPYDANHIIGFGKDTVVEKAFGDQPQAYYQGMKVAIFDVTDVNSPQLKHQVVIGARGTDSELLRDHKALLFDKNKNLLAFPITVMEKKGTNSTGSPTEYGQFSFAGAYVYNIDLQNGLTLKGKLTHLTQEDYNKAGDYWYDSDSNIRRIIYIGDNLYTISDNKIKACDLSTLQEKGEVQL